MRRRLCSTELTLQIGQVCQGVARAGLTPADGARGGTYAIQEDQCTTAKPLNVNDGDLSSTTTALTPRPPDELTDWSFEVRPAQPRLG